MTWRGRLVVLCGVVLVICMVGLFWADRDASQPWVVASVAMFTITVVVACGVSSDPPT